MSMPNAMALGAHRGSIELKQFFRERASVVFTFTFPALLLLLLGSIFDGDVSRGGVTGGQVLTASFAAAGIVSTSFVNLGSALAVERDDGTLKRLRALPMPPVSFFLGKIVLVVVAGLAELALLLAIGAVMFDLPLLHDPVSWFTMAWLFVLGVTACSLLGIAASSLARSARSAGAITMVPYTVLLFISGVYIPHQALPGWMADLGAVFPIKWLAQGFRAALLPDHMAELEPAGRWELDRVAIVLALWCAGGLVLCLTTFRWRSSLTR
ncbi:ABC transporter permease [Glycomyces sp. L485]|uniref:ABC transporter permease n=1 Tax=Glycomyces sp. L485 TaxID=2909235 RepID=UPI001F4B9A07|nr:ABC transporter permease [Glycomyces sp. L485]MCH7230531.1 ABC transporter permease [Glycomyces sp. L485]